MRTTINIDETLLQDAMDASGETRKTEVIRKALKALVRRHAAIDVIKLGGSEPGIIKTFYETPYDGHRHR